MSIDQHKKGSFRPVTTALSAVGIFLAAATTLVALHEDKTDPFKVDSKREPTEIQQEQKVSEISTTLEHFDHTR